TFSPRLSSTVYEYTSGAMNTSDPEAGAFGRQSAVATSFSCSAWSSAAVGGAALANCTRIATAESAAAHRDQTCRIAMTKRNSSSKAPEFDREYLNCTMPNERI